MTTRRCAGTVALIMLVAAAFVLAGCGGNGDGVQTGSVSGTITYAATGDALGGIQVSIGNIRTTTNARGEFTLNRVPAGQRQLAVEAPPERNLVVPPGVPMTVNVQAGQTTRLPAPIQMIDDVDAPPSPPS